MSNQIKRTFIGEAASYQKTRPNYPAELFAALLEFWTPNVSSHAMPIIADIGCGTGIAARGMYATLQDRGKIIGIDPNFKMLQQAKQATLNNEDIIYLEGNAEQLPFENRVIDIIMVAQAMQYFNRPVFYTEASRVLKNNGAIAIIENNRNWHSSQFLRKYEEFLEKNSYDKNFGYYTRDYRAFPFIEELKNYFNNTATTQFFWTKEMLPIDFLTMVKSSTSGQRAIANIGNEAMEQIILTLAQSYLNKEGLLEIQYTANAYLAKNTLFALES